MVVQSKVTCDTCNADLTYTTNCMDWRLALVNQRVPCLPECMLTSTVIHPKIEEDAHFCGVTCLKTWLKLYKNSHP